MTLGTVVVTGVTTFIGCHLVPAFAHAGYRVVGALHTPVAGMDWLRAERWRRAEPALSACWPLDLNDPDAIHALVVRETPRFWIQLAGIGKDFASDLYDLDAAARIDLLSLDAIYHAMGEAGGGVLAAGSSMEYGAVAWPHKEDLACWPDTSYGLAKLASTLRARQLAVKRRVPTRIARIYTLFGQLDSPTRLVARLVQRLAAGQPVGVAPGAFRDVCDVADIVDGYLAMAADCARDSSFDIFNLSRGQPTELKELALLVAAEIGADPALIVEDRTAIRAAEPAVICGDRAKASALLGWAPRPIPEGLAMMVGRPAAAPVTPGVGDGPRP